MSTFYRPVILNAFPESTWPEIERCVLQGIHLADSSVASTPFLNWSVGRDQRGDLRRASVMWTLKEAIAAERLPFTCEVRENTIKNCHHIQISSQNLYLHVNRTTGAEGMPRDTVLRKNERQSNQGDLLLPRPGFITTDLSQVNKFYGWLTFGADGRGRLTHLGIGMPDAEKDQWLDLVSLLGASAAEAEVPDDEPRAPGPEDMVRFRAEVQKMLDPESDDGQEQSDEN